MAKAAHSSFRCPNWLREGGLYLIVSGIVTVLKYVLLLFLPRAFSFLPMRDFGWPGLEMTLLGETFRWNIFGYDTAHGGLPYLCAYMTAMVLGECVKFPASAQVCFPRKRTSCAADSALRACVRRHHLPGQLNQLHLGGGRGKIRAGLGIHTRHTLFQRHHFRHRVLLRQ